MLEKTSFLSSVYAIEGMVASFIKRISDVEVTCDREEVMNRLHQYHVEAINDLDFTENNWARAEQVHENEVAIVKKRDKKTIKEIDCFPVYQGVDGLITNEKEILLAIYVADCGVIWLVDKKTKAIGLLHSGKKGTELNIFKVAVKKMTQEFNSQPSDIIAVLGPCIRPPNYEINFAEEIRNQARELGIVEFHDCGICTGSDLENYYSYRKEQGKTGRMMALLGKKYTMES
jgi:polyphenol oxidase